MNTNEIYLTENIGFAILDIIRLFLQPGYMGFDGIEFQNLMEMPGSGRLLFKTGSINSSSLKVMKQIIETAPFPEVFMQARSIIVVFIFADWPEESSILTDVQAAVDLLYTKIHSDAEVICQLQDINSEKSHETKNSSATSINKKLTIDKSEVRITLLLTGIQQTNQT